MNTALKISYLSIFLLLMSACENLVPGLENYTKEPQVIKTDPNVELARNLEESNALLDESKAEILMQMKEWVNDKPHYQLVYDCAEKAEEDFSALSSSIDQLCNKLAKETLDFSSNTEDKDISKTILFEYGDLLALQNRLNPTLKGLWQALDFLPTQIRLKESVNRLEQVLSGEAIDSTPRFNFEPKDIEKLKAEFALKPIDEGSWANENFRDLGASASYAKLRRLQSDIKKGFIQFVRYLKSTEVREE